MITFKRKSLPLILGGVFIAVAILLSILDDRGALQGAVSPFPPWPPSSMGSFPGSSDDGSLSSSYSGGFQSSQPIGFEQCQMKIVNGILQKCCKTPYSIYYTCRQFTDTFVQLCLQAGVSCSSIHIWCPPVDSHVIGQAVIDGLLCLVEPQGDIVSCDVGTEEKYAAALCTAMGKPSGCNCSVVVGNSSSNGSVDTEDTSMCALKFVDALKQPNPNVVNLLNDCQNCCNDEIVFYQDLGYPFVGAWLQACLTSCNSVVNGKPCPPTSSGFQNCGAGFVADTCNPATCEQTYNTGLCNSGTTSCLTLVRSCEHAGISCDNPNLPPNYSSPSSSAGSSSGGSPGGSSGGWSSSDESMYSSIFDDLTSVSSSPPPEPQPSSASQSMGANCEYLYGPTCGGGTCPNTDEACVYIRSQGRCMCAVL